MTAIQVIHPVFVQVSLDKLYMSAANHVFEKKMKPLLLEQRKRGQGHGYNNETFKVAKTMMKYINCIQSPEWAAATAHKITQELPPGLICTLDTAAALPVCLYACIELFSALHRLREDTVTKVLFGSWGCLAERSEP